MKKFAVGTLSIFLILFIMCQKTQFKNFPGSGALDDQQRIVALVGPDTLNLKDYNQALNNNGWHREKNLDTLNFKLQVLRNEVVHRAARIKARDYPLEMTPEIRDRLQDHLNTVLRQILFDKKVMTNIAVSEADIAKYYDDNQGEFWQAAQASIAQIVFYTYRPFVEKVYGIEPSVPDEEIDSLARKRAARVMARLQAGEDFAELARLYSEDSATAIMGGRTAPVYKGTLEAPLDSLAFSLPIDSVCGPIRAQYGYFIIKVIERLEDRYAPLDSNLSAVIRTRLETIESRRLATHYFDSLYAVTDIEIHEEFFDSSLTSFDSSYWLLSFNRKDTIYYSEFLRWKENELKKNPKIVENSRFRRELLNVIGSTWLLMLEARKNGYEHDSLYLKTKEDFLYQESLNMVLKEKFGEDYEPTEAEINAYYDRNKRLFTEDSAISIQQIILEDQKTAERVKQILDKGANFYETAIQYYPGDQEEIKKMAINLGWVGRNDISPEFFDQIYKLNVDEVSRPIKSAWGYHIVKVLGKKGQKPLESVRIDIRKELINTHKQEQNSSWEERMLAGIDVRVDYQLVNDFMFRTDWLPKPDFSKMFNPY